MSEDSGLPDDFIAQLDAVADEMLESLRQRQTSRTKVKGATSGLQSRLTVARSVVHVIDAFVRTALKNDSALLSTWNGAKRVPKTRGRAAATTTPVQTTPVVSVSTSTTPIAAAA